MAFKGTASKSASGASMSKYDVEVEERLQALEAQTHPDRACTDGGGGDCSAVEARLKKLEEQVITLSIQLQETLDKEASADTIKGEQNARWDALNKFMKHQFVVEF